MPENEDKKLDEKRVIELGREELRSKQAALAAKLKPTGGRKPNQTNSSGPQMKQGSDKDDDD